MSPALLDYPSSLRSFVNSQTFADIPNSDLGLGITTFKNAFIDKYKDLDDEDRKEMDKIGESILSQFKHAADIPRFTPKNEDFETYYGKAPNLNQISGLDNKIKAVDEFVASAKEKAASIRPSDAEDMAVHLDGLANDYIREEAGKENKSGWMSDKAYRGIEGALTMFTPFISGSDRFLAEHLPEDTARDRDFSSDVASGIGQLISQFGIGAAVSVTAGPQAVVPAISAIYSARALKEGYDMEMKKSGNPLKALEVGVNGIPGALLETYADQMLFGLGKEGTSILKAFKEAGTEELKRKILVAAIPKLGTQVVKNAVAEGTVGSIGADFTTGYGRYLASGDDSYIPSGEALLRGGAVEALLGGGFTAITGGGINADRKQAAKDLFEHSDKKANQEEIFNALKAGNFDEAVKLSTQKYEDKQAPANAPASNNTNATNPANPAPNTTPNVTTPKDSDSSIFSSLMQLRREEARLRATGNLEDVTRADEIKKSITDINSNSYKFPDTIGISPTIPDYEVDTEPLFEKSKNDSNLKLGGVLEDSEDILYVDPRFTREAVANETIKHGGIGLRLTEDEDGLQIINSKNQVGSTRFEYTGKPRKGWVAVKINEKVSHSSDNKQIITSFSVIGNVDSLNNDRSTKEYEANKQKLAADLAASKKKKEEDALAKKAANAANAANKVAARDAAKAAAAALAQEKQIKQRAENLTKAQDKDGEIRKSISSEENLHGFTASKIKVSLNSIDSILETYNESLKWHAEESDVRKSIQALHDSLVEVRKNLVDQVTSSPSEIAKRKRAASKVNVVPNINPTDTTVTPPVVNEAPPVVSTAPVQEVNEESPFNKVKSRKTNTQPKKAKVETNTETNPVKNPKAVTETIVNNTPIEHTVDKPNSPVVVEDVKVIENHLTTLKDQLSKPQNERLGKRSDEKLKILIAEREAQLRFIKSTNTNTIPEALKAQEDEVINEPITPVVEAKKEAKKKGLKEGEIAAVDVVTVQSKRGSDIHEFTAKGVNYVVRGALNGWYLVKQSNPESTKEGDFLFLAQTKKDSTAKLAKLVNEGEDLSNFIKTKEEIKSAVYTPKNSKGLKLFNAALDKHISALKSKVKAKFSSPVFRGDAERFFNVGGREKFLESERNKDSFTSVELNVLDRIMKETDSSYMEDTSVDKIENRRKGIRYSIASNPSNTNTISQEDAETYIKDNNLPVEVVDTREVTEDGYQWNGRTDFRGSVPRISVNVSNIETLADLRNIINEELAHVAYNDSTLSQSLNKITSSTEVREGLDSVYSEQDIAEESVVKRVADLVDQYNEKGTFAKIVANIKSYIKDKLGLELNDSDLSVIAASAVNRASKSLINANKAIPAGGGFDFGLAEFTDGQLIRSDGTRTTVNSNGEMDLKGFKLKGGNEVLSDDEISFYKQLVPEAFRQSYTKEAIRKASAMTGRLNKDETFEQARDKILDARFNKSLWKGDIMVNIQKLRDGLLNAGENIRVNVFEKNGEVNKTQDRINELRHIIETNRDKYDVNDAGSPFPNADTPAELAEQIEEFSRLRNSIKSGKRAQWMAITSGNLDEGYFELSVSVKGDEKMYRGELREASYFANQHAPFPDNTIVHTRVRIVKRADGTRVGLVEEIQGDWVQTSRKEKEDSLKSLPSKITSMKKTIDDAFEDVRRTGGAESWAAIRNDKKESGWRSATGETYSIEGDAIASSRRYLDNLNNELTELEAKLKKAHDNTPDHPTFPVHQAIGIKATINELEKRGITEIAIVDGETAMITEGHDKAAKGVVVKRIKTDSVAERQRKYEDLLEKYPDKSKYDVVRGRDEVVVYDRLNIGEPSQSGGMRLAYDVTIPSIMKRLVGEGRVEDFGVHGKIDAVKQIQYDGFQKEFDTILYQGSESSAPVELQRQAYQRVNNVHKAINGEVVTYYKKAPKNSPDKLIGSPAFKNKTNITARVYNIENLSSRVKTLYSKVNPNNNTNQQQSIEEEIADFISISQGEISNEHKRLFNRVNETIKKKLEKELLIDEPQAWKNLKSVNVRYLTFARLREFDALLSEFVNSRTKTTKPYTGGIRMPIGEVIDKASAFIRDANQGYFEAKQSELEELLGDKDFEKDFGSSIDHLNQAIKDHVSATDSSTPPNQAAMDKFKDGIYNMLDLIRNTPDFALNKLNEMFPEMANGDHITNPEIKAQWLEANGASNAISSSVKDSRERFVEVFKQLVKEPLDNDDYRSIRMQYYGLEDFLSHGYALNTRNFISEKKRALLEKGVDENKIADIHKWKAEGNLQGFVASFATNIKSMGNSVAEFAYSLTAEFRESIDRAEEFHRNFTQPLLKKFMDKAIAANGGKEFTDMQLNHAGIYGMARNFKVSEEATKGLFITKQALSDSIKKNANSKWKNMKAAAAAYKEFLDALYIGIDANTKNEDALAILDKNAESILHSGLIQYVKDGVEMFDAVKPFSKFTSEFGYGRVFEEWNNYIPFYAMNKDGFIKLDITDMSSSVDDRMFGDFSKDSNMMRQGMGSLMERSRKLGDSKVYVFNINNMFENRMRLNMIDNLSIIARRELNNIISQTAANSSKDDKIKSNTFKAFANALKDSDGQQERVAHIQKTVRTMWNNTVQSAEFITNFQAGFNVLASAWATGKLASLYQFPAQLISNIAPYFVVNSTSPERIGYLFTAMNILLKKQMGVTLDPRLDRMVSKVIDNIHSRKQESFLEKSVALDVGNGGKWQWIKSTPMYSSLKGINKFREKVLMFPFIASDFASGAPMLLANYMHYEKQAGRATDFDVLTYNNESWVKSVDETERFIGIGGATRRGNWTSNKNGWVSLFRNILSAFSSHRVNNAANFRVEYGKIMSGALSPEEKIESARYMAGIAAQSLTFSLVKWSMLSTFYSMLSSAMGDKDNEEELNTLLRKMASGNYRKEDKANLEAEIAMRSKIRNEFENAKDKNSDKEVLMINFLKDSFSNSMVFPAITDAPLNMVLHIMDKFEAEQFNGVKNQQLKDLKEELKIAKARNNTSDEVEITKSILRLESQEAVITSYENKSVIPFEGVYGGVLKDAYKFTESAAKAVRNLDITSIPISDVFLGTGLLGLSQPEVNKIARMYSKRATYEQEFKDKVKEIETKKQNKLRGIK